MLGAGRGEEESRAEEWRGARPLHPRFVGPSLEGVRGSRVSLGLAPTLGQGPEPSVFPMFLFFFAKNVSTLRVVLHESRKVLEDCAVREGPCSHCSDSGFLDLILSTSHVLLASRSSEGGPGAPEQMGVCV